jgi:xanthine/CO dehydrogenase XdhC/CoxF family maturation factor
MSLDKVTLPDNDVLDQAFNWLDAGAGVAIATVVSTWGSSPRPVGSHLCVRDDGAMAGSVSGGCVEGAVLRLRLDDVQSGGGSPGGTRLGVIDHFKSDFPAIDKPGEEFPSGACGLVRGDIDGIG